MDVHQKSILSITSLMDSEMLGLEEDYTQNKGGRQYTGKDIGVAGENRIVCA